MFEINGQLKGPQINICNSLSPFILILNAISNSIYSIKILENISNEKESMIFFSFCFLFFLDVDLIFFNEI